jgi:hypothetical protein
MSAQEKAVVGFVAGAVGLVVLQSYTTRQASALGLPHVAVGLITAVIAHEVG